MQKNILKIVLKKLLAALALAPLLATVCLAEPLPELDCLVEPNIVVDIGSPEHGVVETIAVDRSDTVSAHDILAKLESSEQAAEVRKANARARMSAELEAREATLAFAERKQNRMRDLYASDAISSHQRDEVETELKMAQMQLQQARDARSLARIELDRAKGDLDRRTIRSPISGIVVERFVSPGEYVNEKPLMRVAQMDPLRVETIAPAKLFGKIKPGMRARVTAEAHSDQVMVAEVTIVDRMIDPASGTFGIRLELPNPDYAIPSGLNCRLNIFPQQRVAAVTEPKAVVDASASLAKTQVKAETNPTDELERPVNTAPATTVEAKPETKTAAAPEPEPVVKTAATPAEAVKAKPEPKAAPVPELNPVVKTATATPAAAVNAKPEPEPVQSAELQQVTPPKKEQPNDELPGPATTVEAKPETNPARAAVLASAVPTGTEQANDSVAQLALSCTTFGPFSNDDQLDALLMTLGADAREVGRRAENDQQKKGFFVATRPMATIAEAQALSDLMNKYGINDLAVLPDGPKGARVSLGLFARWIDANNKHRKLAAFGIETEVFPNLVNTRQLWLDVELPTKTLEWAPWNKLAPDLKTATCEPSLYVMTDTVGPRKNAK